MRTDRSIDFTSRLFIQFTRFVHGPLGIMHFVIFQFVMTIDAVFNNFAHRVEERHLLR